MKYFSLLFLIFSSWCFTASAQDVRIEYKIADTGCRVKLYCDSVKFTPIVFGDNKGYLADECLFENNEGCGMIYVKFWKPIGLLDDPYAGLIALLDDTKENLNIVSADFGYTKAIVEQSGSKAEYALTDTWKDKEGDIYKVKGWTNGNHTAVLYYWHPPADNPFDFMEEDAEIDRFLNGFKFPLN